MYRKIDDFKKDWLKESEATLKIFGSLTDESLNQKVSPEGRTLGRLAWHITTSLGEMMRSAGVNIDSVDEKSPVPSSAKEIYDIYKSDAEKVGKTIPALWNEDESLNDMLDMYGQKWSKGTVLSILIVHQIHHRGQMTVLMRQAGLKVPGVYGPAKEEWTQYGMPVQD